MIERVQLSRKKGWKMPPNTVSVSRPGHWGNCYKIGMPAPSWMRKETLETAEDVVRAYKHMCLTMPGKVMEIRTFLRGKNLACWCKPGTPCHADTLLELANTQP